MRKSSKCEAKSEVQEVQRCLTLQRRMCSLNQRFPKPFQSNLNLLLAKKSFFPLQSTYLKDFQRHQNLKEKKTHPGIYKIRKMRVLMATKTEIVG